MEFTAFFKGVAIALPCCLAAFLVMVSAECCMGGLPGFLEIPVARAVGVEIARKSGAEFYFRGEDTPDDQWCSWLDTSCLSPSL